MKCGLKQQQQDNDNCSNAFTGHRPPPRTLSRFPRCLIAVQLHTYIWKEKNNGKKCKLQSATLMETNRRSWLKCIFSPRIHLQPGLQLTRLGGVRSLQNFPGFCLNHFDWQVTHLAALIHGLQDIMKCKEDYVQFTEHRLPPPTAYITSVCIRIHIYPLVCF